MPDEEELTTRLEHERLRQRRVEKPVAQGWRENQTKRIVVRRELSVEPHAGGACARPHTSHCAGEVRDRIGQAKGGEIELSAEMLVGAELRNCAVVKG